MNSSSDPPVHDGLTFITAARLHARRFDRSVVSSIFLLNASDRLVTDSAGGVLALTDLRRSKWRARLLGATFVGGLGVVLWAGLQGMLLLGAAAIVALLLHLVVIAPRTVRSLQATRRHVGVGEAWLVTDVATEPRLGVGDRIVGRACELADRNRAALLLDVATTNRPAVRLYKRHGFEVVTCDNHRTAMRRSPHRSGDVSADESQDRTPRARDVESDSRRGPR